MFMYNKDLYYMHILYMHIIKGVSVYRNEKNKGKQAAFKQNHHQNYYIFYLEDMIQIIDIRDSNSLLFIPCETVER